MAEYLTAMPQEEAYFMRAEEGSLATGVMTASQYALNLENLHHLMSNRYEFWPVTRNHLHFGEPAYP